MYPRDNLEELVERQQKQIKELTIRIEMLDREIDHLHQELKLSPQQVSEFLQNKSNFSEVIWEELQKQKQILDEKLQKELENLRQPQKTKEKLKDLHLAQNWIRMR
jgi:ABC-type Fe2+-enterobactin transport system substrate-binding protein